MPCLLLCRLVTEVLPNILSGLGLHLLEFDFVSVLESLDLLLLLHLYFLSVSSLQTEMLWYEKISNFGFDSLPIQNLLFFYHVLSHLVSGYTNIVKWYHCFGLLVLELNLILGEHSIERGFIFLSI